MLLVQSAFRDFCVRHVNGLVLGENSFLILWDWALYAPPTIVITLSRRGYICHKLYCSHIVVEIMKMLAISTHVWPFSCIRGMELNDFCIDGISVEMASRTFMAYVVSLALRVWIESWRAAQDGIDASIDEFEHPYPCPSPYTDLRPLVILPSCPLTACIERTRVMQVFRAVTVHIDVRRATSAALS
ncbi:hypothetical protein SCHPADRAFT_937836 [Schizopora paradoxa]|uniref:Uncharacterized protein n=1 Tax=Schizopora paradoxa TaxID=27342 RepID=A0A0H2RXK6_9AGAM|nr:hypothetical protein SCHPADRAFT_937836 [Schizopora paradoxa]